MSTWLISHFIDFYLPFETFFITQKELGGFYNTIFEAPLVQASDWASMSDLTSWITKSSSCCTLFKHNLPTLWLHWHSEDSESPPKPQDELLKWTLFKAWYKCCFQRVTNLYKKPLSGMLGKQYSRHIFRKLYSGWEHMLFMCVF